MALILYEEWNPKPDTVKVIDQANEILDEYTSQGYDLSLRQLYYQFVARDLIPNNQRSYKRLGEIITKARNAGMVDWDTITDRGRSTYYIPSYENGDQFLQKQAYLFHLNHWKGQPRRVQVWVEKEALADVVARAANRWDCSYFPYKGYASNSSIWASAQEMLLSATRGECNEWVILQLADHDPSGIDMTRDITERLNRYTQCWQEHHVQPRIEVRRIALNIEQIETYDPPPNFAKETDSRHKSYKAQFGTDSWELDALEPKVIVDIISKEIEALIEDRGKFDDIQDREIVIREQLQKVNLDSVA